MRSLCTSARAANPTIVEDAHGIALAYVYFEDEPTRRSLLNRLSGDDAKAVAQMIARALTAEAEGRVHASGN